MKRIIIAAVAAVVLLGAAGLTTYLVVDHRKEVAAQEREDEQKAERDADRAAAKAEAEEAEAARVAAFEECLDETEGYFDAVQAVDALVTAGVSYNNYSAQVQAAVIASSQVRGVDDGCQQGLVDRLDEAVALYSAVDMRWNECIFGSDFSCDPETIDLQTDWLSAAVALLAADAFVDSEGQLPEGDTDSDAA